MWPCSNMSLDYLDAAYNTKAKTVPGLSSSHSGPSSYMRASEISTLHKVLTEELNFNIAFDLIQDTVACPARLYSSSHHALSTGLRENTIATSTALGIGERCLSAKEICWVDEHTLCENTRMTLPRRMDWRPSPMNKPN